ncbi:MAG: hypothetical protein KatS3mg051_2201 [Anaerolineae bacterium]|nr:MAG: hypothetical protein KatS3mg051_2201 [Anaerolineae bacterium]
MSRLSHEDYRRLAGLIREIEADPAWAIEGLEGGVVVVKMGGEYWATWLPHEDADAVIKEAARRRHNLNEKIGDRADTGPASPEENGGD